MADPFGTLLAARHPHHGDESTIRHSVLAKAVFAGGERTHKKPGTVRNKLPYISKARATPVFGLKSGARFELFYGVKLNTWLSLGGNRPF